MGVYTPGGFIHQALQYSIYTVTKTGKMEAPGLALRSREDVLNHYNHTPVMLFHREGT